MHICVDVLENYLQSAKHVNSYVADSFMKNANKNKYNNFFRILQRSKWKIQETSKART